MNGVAQFMWSWGACDVLGASTTCHIPCNLPITTLTSVTSTHAATQPHTGAVTSNSTWTYKVPAVSCVPERLSVSLLRDSPLHLEVRAPGGQKCPFAPAFGCSRRAVARWPCCAAAKGVGRGRTDACL